MSVLILIISLSKFKIRENKGVSKKFPVNWSKSFYVKRKWKHGLLEVRVDTLCCNKEKEGKWKQQETIKYFTNNVQISPRFSLSAFINK